MNFDRNSFLDDLQTFVAFKTVVCQNPEEFCRANAWIRGLFDSVQTDFIDFDCHGLTSTVIKPRGSERPNLLGDGHIEVVPAEDSLFDLRERQGILVGRGVADMKTQCLTMIYVLRDLIAEGRHNDFWLVLSEDEEVGSKYGVKIVAEHLQERGLLPGVVFAPDGGPDFAYVEKEKGAVTIEVDMPGKAAHASRPYLGDNAIDRMMELYAELRRIYPNPQREADWVISLSMTGIGAGGASNRIPDSCRAGFDLRLTEDDPVAEVTERLGRLVEEFGGRLRVVQADPATYYPREAPIAQEFLQILRRVSGREPRILHSAGASNGRIYVAREPATHVLMSSPAMGSAHSAEEWLDAASLDAYYQLVLETALLQAR